jgi:hypothetical protein
MGLLRPETMKLIAREIYDYDLSDENARALANSAGAIQANSRHLSTARGLDSIEPPFGYPNLEAEAALQRLKGR